MSDFSPSRPLCTAPSVRSRSADRRDTYAHCTVTGMVAECDRDPEVPVTATLYVPAVVPDVPVAQPVMIAALSSSRARGK